MKHYTATHPGRVGMKRSAPLCDPDLDESHINSVSKTDCPACLKIIAENPIICESCGWPNHVPHKKDKASEKKEWWFCNKNSMMVYDQMCYDCCFIDEIWECLDVRDKPEKRGGL